MALPAMLTLLPLQPPVQLTFLYLAGRVAKVNCGAGLTARKRSSIGRETKGFRC